jgi:hypothetical protein
MNQIPTINKVGLINQAPTRIKLLHKKDNLSPSGTSSSVKFDESNPYNKQGGLDKSSPYTNQTST